MRLFQLIIISVFSLTFWSFATEYYVDFKEGRDENDGTSQSSAFMHCPGDTAAKSIAKSIKLVAGDVVYFKRGVSYTGLIRCNNNGYLCDSARDGSITPDGIFKSPGRFLCKTARVNDFIYIYNYEVDPSGNFSQGGKYLGTVGLYVIEEVDVVNNSLKIRDFKAKPHSKSELSYMIWRPISYTSKESYGSGEAILDANFIYENMFQTSGKDYLRWSKLKFINTFYDCTKSLGANCIEGAGSGPHYGLVLDSCTFENINTACRTGSTAFSVFRSNRIINYGSHGLFVGSWGLVENNFLDYGTQGILYVSTQSVARFNTIKNSIKKTCENHANAFAPIGGGTKYGWIYGNTIINCSAGIPLTWSGGGSRGYVIHSNILIGAWALDKTGDGITGCGSRAIQVYCAPETKIYNNVIISMENSIGWVEAISIREGSKGTGASPRCELKNNIFYMTASNSGGVIVGGGTSTDSSNIGFSSSHNIFYYPKRSKPLYLNGQWMSSYNWMQSVGDNTSISSDPLFVNVKGIYPDSISLHLQTGSLARKTGVFVPEVSCDRDGYSRPVGTIIDRGAFEDSRYIPRPVSGLRTVLGE